MKKILFVISAIIFSANAQAQSEVTLYGVKIKATEVKGPSSNNFCSVEAYKCPDRSLQPMPIISLTEILGSTYNNLNFNNISPFLNSGMSDAEILDTIEVVYLNKFGLADMRIKLKNASQEFEKEFKKRKSVKEKMEYFNEYENYRFKRFIDSSKYEITLARPISIDKTREKQLSLGLTAGLKGVLKKVLNLNASTNNKIIDSVFDHVEVKDLVYRELRLKKSYVTTVNSILKKYWADKKLKERIKNDDADDFSKQVNEFLESDNTSIIAYVSVISATFSTSTTTVNNLGLGISGAGDVDVANNNAKVNASVKASYDNLVKDVRKSGGIMTNFVIKYGANKDLEIGNGAPER